MDCSEIKNSMNYQEDEQAELTADPSARPADKNKIHEEASENLGLDADRSSDDQRIDRKYNMDNDMVSNNPDGEDDRNDANLERGSSPLMDK